MAWWPWGAAWISLGRIDVDRMEQGAIQVGNNVSPRGGGGGGGGGSITLINSAGDLSYSTVWHSFVASSSGQGVGGQMPMPSQGQRGGPRPIVSQPKRQAATPVYTFRFDGGDSVRRRRK